jgi:large subunit ribosomal protein L16
MLTPKNVKYHTPHRVRFKGWASSGTYVAYGKYGIQSLQQSWFTSRQIETSRRILIRYVRRNGKLWIRIYPDKIIMAILI